MSLNPSWADIALRLFFTMLAGGMIGINRGARGHAAGLRTTLLVALTAAIAMIQVNILLPLSGKAPDSFVQVDLMRLPLGVLTGVGFIGGGAILKRGGAVTGVTTAATLWVATAIGLCFGAGLLALGAAATALGILTLWGLKWVDDRMPRQHRAMLGVSIPSGRPAPNLSPLLANAGYTARFCLQRESSREGEVDLAFELRWKQAGDPDLSLGFLKEVGAVCTVRSFEIVSEDFH